MLQFAVIGNKIDYSLSPKIHNYNFKISNIDAIYNIININNIVLEIDKIRHLTGFNVTTPFKEEIVSFCDFLSDEAKVIKAVNCVKSIDNKLYGFNTDVFGFYYLIKNNQIDKLKNAKVLIIGAGGGAKAVYYCLNKYFNFIIDVTNRTFEKINFSKNAIRFTDINLENYDIIINCTNVGVKEYTTPIEIKQIKKNSVFIDINYQKNNKFLDDAKQKGANTINGLDMLLAQALKSYEIWFNMPGDINNFKNSIRKDI